MVNGIQVGEYLGTGDTELDQHIAIAKLKELGYMQAPQPEWMLIRSQAMNFYETCNLLWGTGLATPMRNRSIRPFVAVPYVVNATFCMELFLKALAAKSGAILRGHELGKLYEHLPADAKIEIEKCTPLVIHFLGDGETPDISKYLKALNHAFIQWRYAHEHKELSQLNLNQIQFLQHLLYNACKN